MKLTASTATTASVRFQQNRLFARSQSRQIHDMSGKVILVAGITRVIRKPARGNSVEHSSGRHWLEERATGEHYGQRRQVSTTDIDHQQAIAEIVSRLRGFDHPAAP